MRQDMIGVAIQPKIIVQSTRHRMPAAPWRIDIPTIAPFLIAHCTVFVRHYV